MRLLTTRHFKRDLKRIRKRGKVVEKLHAIVEKLLKGEPLPPRASSFRQLAGVLGMPYRAGLASDLEAG